MGIKNSTVYLAVRLSADGYEWADVQTTSGCPDNCRQLARNTDHEIPNWAKANPVQRIQQFDLVAT